MEKPVWGKERRQSAGQQDNKAQGQNGPRQKDRATGAPSRGKCLEQATADSLYHRITETHCFGTIKEQKGPAACHFLLVVSGELERLASSPSRVLAAH